MNSQTDSPCIKVCRIADGVCVGCGRTLDEIRRWSRMDEDERAAIVARQGQGRQGMNEERPQYLNPQTLIEQLRGMARYENSDFSLGDDAADEIEALRREVERLRDALEVASDTFADIQLRARLAARAAVKQIREK